MSKGSDWKEYLNSSGKFELAAYIYSLILGLMKQSLDLGTLLSNDPAKLRAYKEQIKSTFKQRWLDIASALEAFEIIEPCGCSPTEFCKECGGSRYRLSSALSADEIREITTFVGSSDDETAKKLHRGLRKALDDMP